MADPAEVLQRLEDMRVTAHLLSKLKYAQATTRSALAAEFEKIGLTTPQFLALAAIEQNADISSAELARQSFCSPQAMITIAARLRASGLITRSPAAGGGRSLTMRLTDKGRATLTEARAHAYAIERYIFDLLGADAYAQLLQSLDRVTDAFAQSATFTRSTPWDAYVENPPPALAPAPAASKARKRRA
jgi:DNA-binding MarR family transcriptional regulator